MSRLGELVDAYLEEIEPKHTRGNHYSYQRTLGRLLRFAEEEDLDHPAELTVERLERLTTALYREPLAASTKGAMVAALRAFFRWLRRNGHILETPMDAIAAPRRTKPLPARPLTAKEVERLLEVIDVSQPLGLRDRALIELLYSTGLRRAELVGLDLGDIDFDRGVVHVRHGKNDKARLVPAGDRALEWVKRYVNEVRPFLAEPDAGDAVFVGSRGRRLEGPGMIQRLYLHAEAAGLEGVTIHLLRHTAATLMLENGADVRFIQELLGHSRLDTTAIYTRVAPTELQKVHARTHPAEREPDDEVP